MSIQNNLDALKATLVGIPNKSQPITVAQAITLSNLLLEMYGAILIIPTLDEVTTAGNTTNNDIISGLVKLSSADGIVYTYTVNLSYSSPASAIANTLGVDSDTSRLYYKNHLNDVIYLDGEVGNLSFDNLTGMLTLTNSLGDSSTTSLDGRYLTVYERSASNGVAPLDTNSKVPSSYLPAVPINNTFVVADEPARLGLGAAIGDVAVQIDTQESYILQSLPPNTNVNWVKLLFPASVTSVNGQTGVVSLSTTDVPEGTNKYVTPTNVDPLIENFLGRGVFVYNSANKYVKYADIPSAIAALGAGDRIILSNYVATISSPIVISKDVNILSVDSIITNTASTPIFTDSGLNTTLFLRGQLYLRNNDAAGTAFSFTGAGGFLYLDGLFDFRDTKTTVTCAKQYCLIGLNTQPTDVLNFTSVAGNGGTLVARGVGVINYSGGGTHYLTGVVNTLNVTSTSVVSQGERYLFDAKSNKSTIRTINLNSGNLVLNTHYVNPLSGSCVTSDGTSSIKSYNTVFVSTPENIVKSSGTLNAQFSNSQFITSALPPMTTDVNFTVTMGYSTGNAPIASLYEGQYFDNINFTSPII